MREKEDYEVCGACRWNRRDADGMFFCGNPNSDRYTEHTYYSDTCEEWSDRYVD